MLVGWVVNEGIVQMSWASKPPFLARFLALLAGWSFFRLVIGLVGLIVGLVIGIAELLVQKLLLTSMGVPYRRNWSAFLDVKLQIMISKYFFPQDIFSILPNSTSLLDSLLAHWQRRRCPKLPPHCTPCCRRPSIL